MVALQVSLLALCAALAAGLMTEPLPAPIHLYPFGFGMDKVAPKNDDGSVGPISLSWRFKFYRRSYSRLYINTNGLISFNKAIPTFTPEWFPLRGEPLIAPYWSDVDTTRNGLIYYVETTVKNCLDMASADVSKAFGISFTAKWMFIATWHRVTYFGGSDETPMNTFQVVLVADRRSSYVIYNYGDIAWTTGKASGGDENGLGGIPAEVGFNAGDRWRYYTQFGSLTPDIIDIRTKTNCGIRGRYVFRVDQREILNPVPKMWTNFRSTSSLGRSASRGKAKKGAPITPPQ